MKPGAYVFTGPTLARTDLVPPEGVTFLPPAAQGDVYRAARELPRAIGIVDGYFEGQASVWHKEILWAMDQGIAVFGSASMGALRAAELHVFGMQGVGRIFEAYRDGSLEDDDEVAVLHAPEEAGFLPLSEPMVNIRATLARAEKQGVIDSHVAKLLTEIAKNTFYQERRWPALFDLAEQQGVDGTVVTEFKTWLPDHRADQKETDALSMIEAIDIALDGCDAPSPASYHFEWTEMWDEVVKSADAAPPCPVGDGSHAASILEEVRLELGPADPLYRLALLRHLALTGDVPERPSHGPTKAIAAFREQRDLFSRADLDRWLGEHRLDAESFERLMTDEATLEQWLIDERENIARHILDQLRLDGRYQRFTERAAAKNRFLQSVGQEAPGPAGPALRVWYFEKRRGEPVPEDLDRYAQSVGFKDRHDFDQALYRDYLYIQSEER